MIKYGVQQSNTQAGILRPPLISALAKEKLNEVPVTIKRSKFPNALLIMPNRRYFFRKPQAGAHSLSVAREVDCGGVATLIITSVGTFGFIFPDTSPLASIDILRFTGSGPVPQEVMDNEDAIHNLQEKRVLFMNFVSAAFFGRVCAKAHTSLIDAIYTGQDRIAAFAIRGGSIDIQGISALDESVGQKISDFSAGKVNNYIFTNDEINDGLSYVQHLLGRQNDFEYADLQSCMVMNYQAAILHNQQHAAASFLLNFSVIESLAREMFTAYGLVNGSRTKSFATKPHSIDGISRGTFNRMKSIQIFKTLSDGSLLDAYLHQRLDDFRIKRNNLMHKGVSVTPKESADCQTIVRDLWAFLVDTPFELNSPWSYRR